LSRVLNVDKKKIKELEKALRYRFRRKYLLVQALTHKSSIKEGSQADSVGRAVRRTPTPLKLRRVNFSVGRDNERLEFLGDAILDLVISDYLYRCYPDYREGELTKFRSHLVNAFRLLKKAREINLEKYIIWGKEGDKEERKDSSLSDAYEAIIGAIYLDRGMKAASKFIYFHFSKEIKSIEQGEYQKDYKSFLQEFSLKRFKEIPAYEVISVEGEEHRKKFKVQVSIKDKVYGEGSGLSIKRAQQTAAQAALKHFGEKVEEKFVSQVIYKEKKGDV